MSYLYILSEDESDDFFYEACLEKITGKTFELVQRRFDEGGISVVRRGVRFLIDDIMRTGHHVEDTYFLVAIDNDRSPEHPTHERINGLGKADKRKQCHFCDLMRAIEHKLGTDRTQWPIQGAVAVPVEMLESWLLLMLQYDPATLPIFKKKTQPSAKGFYGKKTSDQLDELCKAEQNKAGEQDKTAFYLNCVYNHLDPDDLAEKSDSFALFKAQVETWM